MELYLQNPFYAVRFKLSLQLIHVYHAVKLNRLQPALGKRIAGIMSAGLVSLRTAASRYRGPIVSLLRCAPKSCGTWQLLPLRGLSTTTHEHRHNVAHSHIRQAAGADVSDPNIDISPYHVTIPAVNLVQYTLDVST